MRSHVRHSCERSSCTTDGSQECGPCVSYVTLKTCWRTGKSADTFSVLPEYSFDVRPLAPQDAALINGVVINFGTRLIVKPTAAELHAHGVPLTGLYVLAGEETDDPYILPMFNRRLCGPGQSYRRRRRGAG